ncbi:MULTISPECIES: PAS domain-containing protein [Hymenobacter]|uniref:histidine kinase n=2 Tax=Hymenobacter TaxID=89966 RepID=A0ABS6X599_9BACT|nr:MULTISPECIES: PAS domain-containing protein [Hymenobacter]MBO3270634.1 PAS domain-containing protein [Hymenobacter defluvii]MBW3131003.1 PAS domain-containing protein [Hymenobacter profundi]
MPTPTLPIDYQKLFHALPDNFLLMAPNEEATVLDNTDSHVAVSLKSRSQVVGKPLFEAYPVADQNEVDILAGSHAHVRQHRTPHTMPLIRYDLERPAEQGGGFEERYWQATHYPILDEQGSLLYVLQKTEDVTEQHQTFLRNQQMQRELAEQQERTRFIVESLPVMIWTTRPDGTPESFNARWMEFTGASQQEVAGKGWLALLHPEDAPRVAQQWKQAVAKPALFQIEYRLRRHDGQYRWLLVQALPRFTPEGEVSMWIGCGIDIQAQKQLVEELLVTNEQQATLSDQAYQAYQLAESQRLTLNNLLMTAPAVICILRGAEHRYEFVNPEYQRLFPNRQLVGNTVLEALPELADQGIQQLLDQVYETGEPFIGNEIEILLAQEGSSELRKHYFNFTYQLFKENGQKAGITVFAYDVTDLVSARK